jgi:nucleoside diphosphate kinase
MKKYQIQENEKFFKKIIHILNDGGCYIFPSANETYTKQGDFLIGTTDGLKKIKGLVSKDFYNAHFKLKENGE